MRFLPALFLALFLLPVSAFAGPLEDGIDAFDREDYQTAMTLLRPLADQGNAHAEYDIGQLYHFGFGVSPNYAEAVKWFRKAADGGYARAQYMLGYLYNYGRDGLAEDDVAAAQWYRTAAGQGNVHAQIYLGNMYGAGSGVKENFEADYFWSALSDAIDTNSGGSDTIPTNERAMRYGDLAIAKWYLTSEQIAALDKRIQGWKPDAAVDVKASTGATLTISSGASGVISTGASGAGQTTSITIDNGNTTISVNGGTINGSTIFGGSPPVTGEGPAQTDDRQIAAYTTINLEAPVEMTYTSSASALVDRRLSVSAPANILPLVSTAVEDGQLVVKMTGSAILHEPIRVTASGPSPASVALTGAGSFHGRGLNGPGLRLVISGSGDVTAAGKIDRAEVVVSGSGSVDAGALRAREAVVTVSGSGSVQAFAAEAADVTVSGSGSVHMSGNPAKKSVDKTGSGSATFE